MTVQTNAIGLRVFVLACAASGLLVACANTQAIQTGLGGRGSLTFGTDDVESAGAYVDTAGRGAAAVDVSVGVERAQVVAGYEWTHFLDDHFQSVLLGARIFVHKINRAEGVYVLLLGRNVESSHGSTPFFDGFDADLGFLWPIKRPFFLDTSIGWTYIDGDAIREGRESTSELRISMGLRFEM